VINEEDTLKEFYKELEKAKKENNKQWKRTLTLEMKSTESL
jgi:hypothetical protein